MKKFAAYFLGIVFVFALFGACKATKGCGLTSDANKIEQLTSQTEIVAEV